MSEANVSSESPGRKVPAAEAAKIDSRGLRGEIASTLAGDAESFTKKDLGVLKFHGVYQQEDREARAARRAAGLGKSYRFMVRVAMPGGALDADQYLALDALARRVGSRSLRLTTRQGIQFHGVLKGDLRATIQEIHRSLLTTFAACGDIRRNVMACPAPLPGGARAELQELAEKIAEDLEPKTRAYHDIWLDGEKVTPQEEAPEPFYGADYLPRKFKIALAIEDDNCVDAYTQDCALIAAVKDDSIYGFNLLAGGGLGMTHNRPDTMARIASPIGAVEPHRALAAVRTVAAIFRDHGNREDRRHARLKYLIEDWGVERFRRELEERLGHALAPLIPLPPPLQQDHLGRHPQAGGGEFYGLWIENGRLEGRQLDGVRAVVKRFRPGVRATPMQSLLFTGLSPVEVDELEVLIKQYGLTPAEELAPALRGSMACPALPTCGLALADAERSLPRVTRALAAELASRGVGEVPLIVRMTGCPNGCARPYNADVAFVGRKPGTYHVFVGGGARGDGLADLWQSDVPEADLVPCLVPLLEAFAADRLGEEGLGEFYRRLFRNGQARSVLTGREQPAAEALTLGVV